MIRPRRPHGPNHLLRNFLLGTGCLLALAGCGGGSSDDDGDPDAPSGRTIEASDLDLGRYRAEGPEDVPEKTGTLANGRAVEAARIAELVIDPATLDDRFQRAGLPVGGMASPNQITRMFSSEDPKLFKDRVSGATARRLMEEPDRLDVSITVLSFTTPQVAAMVVSRIAANNDRTTTNPITGTLVYGTRSRLPNNPKARAGVLRFSRDPASDSSLVALAGSGRYVIYIYANSPIGKLPELTKVVDRAMTEQLAALEGDEPAELTDLLDLPVDETGLTKLTLGTKPGDPDDQEPDIPSVWGPNGALHLQTWAGDLADALEAADVDVMASGGSNVYRTGSVAKADELLDAFEEASTTLQYRKHHTPKGLRDARCYEAVDEDATSLAPNYCQVRYGRYVAEAAGTSAADAEARISAQYLLLQDEAKD